MQLYTFFSSAADFNHDVERLMEGYTGTLKGGSSGVELDDAGNMIGLCSG